jgi:type IV secretion system protein VirB1
LLADVFLLGQNPIGKDACVPRTGSRRMLDCPELSVPAEVMQHVVHVESSRNPFAIGVVGGYLARQPHSLQEALAAVQQLKEEGYNFSIGIAQVNRYNLAKYGLSTYAEAFQVCPNLKAGSRILRECYDRAQDWGKAFSCYYSGNFSTGFDHGYVQKIFASIRKAQYGMSAQQEPVRIIPYNGNPRKRAREDNLSLGGQMSARAPLRPQPPTPLAVTAAALANAQAGSPKSPGQRGAVETIESRAAIPVPGPGALVPGVNQPGPGGLSHIPTQVVGVNGDPYQTRVLPPTTTGLPASQLPLPQPNAGSSTPMSRSVGTNPSPRVSNTVARKGGNLLHNNESSGKPENTAGAPAAGGATPGPQERTTPADRSFVF